MSTAAPTLAADLTAGLKRLKMAGMRRLAPELLVTAKTQRWNPEEFLRTLVEAEISARDQSNARTRLRTAAFPVAKRLEDFDVAASSIPKPTFDYLASLEWIRSSRSSIHRPACSEHLPLGPRAAVRDTFNSRSRWPSCLPCWVGLISVRGAGTRGWSAVW